ncbi:hypothetical protein Scep_016225 [Stephania cephalantha]|uniref:Uncharacterized protein n=1 Tax=Stephania cephalantha TaxID=152367 RepID=A0AAP0NSE6_9MAGN
MYTPPHPLIMLTSLSRHYLTSLLLTYTLPHLSFSHRTLIRPGRRRNRGGGGEEEEEEEENGARKTGVEVSHLHC